jgi:hypothetical protein
MDFAPVACRPSGKHPTPRVLPRVEVLEDRLTPAVSVTSARWQTGSVDIGFSSSSYNRTAATVPTNYVLLSSGADKRFGTSDDNPIPIEEVRLGSTSLSLRSSGPMPVHPVRFTVRAVVLGGSSNFTDIVYPPGQGGQTQSPTVRVALPSGSDSGFSRTDGVTNDRTPTFDVTVSHAGTLDLTVGGRTERRSVSGAGTIRITWPTLTDGSYSVSARLVTTTGTEARGGLGKSLVIDTHGPRLQSGVSTVTGSSMSTRAVRFTETVVSSGSDPSRFTPVDVSMQGPGGRFVSVTGVLGSGRDYVIQYTPQTQVGEYRITIGTEVADLAGNFLNQDGDAINGEATQDLALDRFSLVRPASTNLAPRLDTAGAFRMPDLWEDAAPSRGVLVRDLIASAGGDRITDPNTGAREGIAIIGANVSHGTWQYSLDNGATWRALGVPTSSSARLLASDTQTRVRFVPDRNWNGALSNGLTFRAWDRTVGNNGEARGISSTGGSTAFSSTADTVSITVRGVNDAPTLDNSGSTRLASIRRNQTNNAGTLVRDLIASAGGDRIRDADLGAREGIAVVGSNTRNGRWEFSLDNGRTWRRFDAPTSSAARLLGSDSVSRVRFVPRLGYTGTVTDGLTFRAWDRTVGFNGGNANITAAGGSTAFSTSTELASITVTV